MTATNQALVFVSGYAPADKPGIQACWFDSAAGALTPDGSVTGILNPSYLAVHPNGHWLYAVSETSMAGDNRYGEVCAVRFEREPFRAEIVNQQSTRGDHPCHLMLDTVGRWLIACNYSSGSVSVFPIGDDGALGEMTDLVQHEGSGAHPERQKGPHAHSATLSPNDRYVIVADLGTDELQVYVLDTSQGKLGSHTHIPARPGAGPRHVAFHPNGRVMYVANELDSTVSVCDFDPATGALAEQQWLSTLHEPNPGNTVADIHVSPLGDRVYVSNRGDNTIAVFAADGEGRLDRVAIASCGGNWPRCFAVAPDGDFMLVANQYSHEVVVLPLQPGGLEVGDPVARVPVAGASYVGFVRP
ncbi:MAG: lactonase family protein [Anaerolineae bacterium]